jgi:hypothetical protein
MSESSRVGNKVLLLTNQSICHLDWLQLNIFNNQGQAKPNTNEPSITTGRYSNKKLLNVISRGS